MREASQVIVAVKREIQQAEWQRQIQVRLGASIDYIFYILRKRDCLRALRWYYHRE